MPFDSTGTEKLPLSINGVRGTLKRSERNASGLFKTQKWVSGRRDCPSWGDAARICVTLRFDDSCGNGHMTFGATADISEGGREAGGGCCHAEIAEAFPELAPLLKWHLCSTDGPMHYIANTLYHAGDRGCEGKTREMDLARSTAIWPEATDAELSVGPEALKVALTARLPGLIADFKAAMTGAGFEWEGAQ